YDKRIDRAVELAMRYPFAKAPLAFFEKVAKFEKELYSQLTLHWGSQPIAPGDGNLRSDINFAALLPEYPKFLTVIERSAPKPLAAAAAEASAQGAPAWMASLNSYWKHGGRDPENGGLPPGSNSGPMEEFLARGFLRGYAEFVGEAIPEPTLDSTPY